MAYFAPEAAAPIFDAVPPLEGPALHIGIPSVLAALSLVLALRRALWKPHVATGPARVRWTESPAGNSPGPYVHPIELLWPSPVRYVAALDVGGTPVPLVGNDALAPVLVPGPLHVATLDARKGSLCELAIRG